MTSFLAYSGKRSVRTRFSLRHKPLRDTPKEAHLFRGVMIRLQHCRDRTGVPLMITCAAWDGQGHPDRKVQLFTQKSRSKSTNEDQSPMSHTSWSLLPPYFV